MPLPPPNPYLAVLSLLHAAHDALIVDTSLQDFVAWTILDCMLFVVISSNLVQQPSIHHLCISQVMLAMSALCCSGSLQHQIPAPSQTLPQALRWTLSLLIDVLLPLVVITAKVLLVFFYLIGNDVRQAIAPDVHLRLPGCWYTRFMFRLEEFWSDLSRAARSILFRLQRCEYHITRRLSSFRHSSQEGIITISQIAANAVVYACLVGEVFHQVYTFYNKMTVVQRTIYAIWQSDIFPEPFSRIMYRLDYTIRLLYNIYRHVPATYRFLMYQGVVACRIWDLACTASTKLLSWMVGLAGAATVWYRATGLELARIGTAPASLGGISRGRDGSAECRDRGTQDRGLLDRLEGEVGTDDEEGELGPVQERKASPLDDAGFTPARSANIDVCKEETVLELNTSDPAT